MFTLIKTVELRGVEGLIVAF
jgi:hypothetical protein